MQSSYLVIIPPLLVIAVALIGRNVVWSLLCGIIAAGIIATNFNPIQALSLVFTRFFEQTDLQSLWYQTGSYDKLFMMGFLSLLGILVEMITHTGGLRLYTQALLKKVHTKAQAELTSLTLSFFFFVDDYLNSLSVGSIMRPLTDHFKVPRAKLAYLLNATSSPLCLIVPASSWVGVILTQLEASGITRTTLAHTLITYEPFMIYLFVIPFLFYPFYSIFNAWYIVSRKLSFGLMHSYEQEAEKTGNLFGGKPPLSIRAEIPVQPHSSPSDVLIPVVTFVIVFLLLVLYSGNFVLFGGDRSLGQAFMNANSIFALFGATLSAVTLSTIRILYKKQMPVPQLGKLSIQGVKLMHNSLIVLLLSWTLSSILQKDLHTGSFIAQTLLSSLRITLIPVIVYLSATLTSASTGSSWGTIMFLAPLVVPLTLHASTDVLVPAVYLIAPVIGALLSGAIAGAHLSPITDATIIASTSAGAYHLDHVQTQVSYSLPGIIGGTVAFLIVGYLYQTSFWKAFFIAGAAGLITCILLLQARELISRYYTKNKKIA